jgi:predicted PurR-regulated permease PerM
VWRLAPDAYDARFIRRVLIVIAFGLLLYALYRGFNILILAFGSTIGPLAIRTIGQVYEDRLHLPHKLAKAAGMLTALAGIIFLIWLFGVQFGHQISQFVTSLPNIIKDLEKMLSASPVGAKIVAAVNAAYAGSRVASDISGLLLGAGTLLLNVIIVIIGSFFLAGDPTAYERGLLLLIPRSKRAPFARAIEETGRTLQLWLRSTLFLMVTMGIEVGIGLWIAGVPSAAALGLLAAVSEFIPYVGPTFAMIPAIGIAATKGSSTLGAAFAVYIAVRLFQTNLVTPWAQKRIIAIPPAITLFCIIGIGVITGIYGLFFAAPLQVAAFSLVRNLYLPEVIGEELAED